MLEVSGDFEIHITAHASQAETLRAFATEHGVKFVHIMLDRGAYVSQPMLTGTAEQWARRLALALDHTWT
ncbi:hypothetical protein ACFW0V_19905 [Micromonospora parva]|uniref:hypothetical protein n=1 Tax=Micromonospora parva TaxID=1464048 RepID=UPI00366C15F7